MSGTIGLVLVENHFTNEGAEMRNHICAEIEKINKSKAFSIQIEISNGKYLLYRSLATTSEVALGEATTEGEITNEVKIGIIFCPFCGDKLK